MTTHYSLSQNTAELREWSKIAATFIRDVLEEKYPDQDTIPMFCYSGMSGVGHATALSLAYGEMFGDDSFAMAYVRKDNEHSHGLRVEYHVPDKGIPVRVFVDDLIGMGYTLRRCITNTEGFVTEPYVIAALSNSIDEIDVTNMNYSFSNNRVLLRKFPEQFQ